MDKPEPAELDRVDELIQLSLKLFLERGYDNTPMSLISKEVGLTKAGIYHHFENKEHILYAVHKKSVEKNLLPLIEKAEQITDAETRLRTYLYDLARQLTREPTATVLLSEARRMSPEHYKEISGVWRRSYGVLQKAIVELQEQGRCPKHINPAFATFAALGSASWIVFWFDYSRPESGEEAARTIVDIFMKGLLS